MIKVEYESYASMYSILQVLKGLMKYQLLAFDVETRSIFPQEEIKKAKALLKHSELVSPEDLIAVKQVARADGLSTPVLVRTTHFVFGLSKSTSIVLIAQDAKTEMAIWNWVVKYPGKLLIHNTGFDLKICYQRTGKFPIDYEDTQLLAKTYINDAENWKSRVGLKILMGSSYDPKWMLFEDYNVANLKNKNFLDYAAIDGAAVQLLWSQLNE